MSGILGHVGGKSGVIGQLTNPYINANTKGQSDLSDSGVRENLYLAGLAFIGFSSSSGSGVALQSGSQGIILGSYNDGGSLNSRGIWFWKRCNGGTSYYDTIVAIHTSAATATGMSLSLDSSHIVTTNVGGIWLYRNNG